MDTEPRASPEEFRARGYCIQPDFLSGKECEDLLHLVNDYRQTHAIPHVYRKVRGRSLNYKVIDGKQIREHLPEIDRLYREINPFVNQAIARDLTPLKNVQVGVNVNITSPGGEYRWHYDRNEVTGILYLNEVEGGETECYPNHRVYVEKWRYSRMQRWLDGVMQSRAIRTLFGRQVLIKPRRGSLVLMRGNRCLHSVRPVSGDADRINVILAYDVPDAGFTVEQKLDSYLYTPDPSVSSDPNYK